MPYYCRLEPYRLVSCPDDCTRTRNGGGRCSRYAARDELERADDGYGANPDAPCATNEHHDHVIIVHHHDHYYQGGHRSNHDDCGDYSLKDYSCWGYEDERRRRQRNPGIITRLKNAVRKFISRFLG